MVVSALNEDFLAGHRLLTAGGQVAIIPAMSEPHEILDIQQQLVRSNLSPMQKYLALVIGRGSWLTLMKYEVIILLCSTIPGALGLVLRKALYPRLLKKCGRNVVFGANIVLRHPKKIIIGDNVVIDDNCLLDAKGDTNAGITIGSGVFIGRNTILHCKNGDIVLGDDVNIGFNCDIASSDRVEIGRKVLIAAYSYIVGGGHDFSRSDTSVMDQKRTAKGIFIGPEAWIGAGVIVQDGCNIGEGTIVGAGAVVTESLPDKVVAVGLPARVLRAREGGGG
jgi:acetyltransferase-like isoleucine patch superfamily enzyme